MEVEVIEFNKIRPDDGDDDDDDCFYIALFSALEQTLRSHVILRK